MKKADKGREGQTKARGWIIWKSHIFFISWASFGVIYCHVCLFFSFKAKKVKKAALVATNTKLQNGKFVALKILLKHPKNVSKPPLNGIWFVKLCLGLLKAKRPKEGQKMEEFWKKL